MVSLETTVFSFLSRLRRDAWPVWQALKGEGERGNSAFRISPSHSSLIKACPTG